MFSLKTSSKNKKLIIFVLVAFLAIQNFAMIEIYKLNFPYAYDMTSLTIFVDYMNSDGDYTANEFFDELLANQNSRGIIFPKLIVSPYYLISNFDSGNIFYFLWIILSFTLLMHFLIIKKINPKLYWTLIPIAAFLYSPLINNNYWNYSHIIMLLPGFSIVAVIYLLSKKLTTKTTIGAVGLSLVATFSIPLALPIWIAGSFVMLRTFIKNKISSLKFVLLYFSWFVDRVCLLHYWFYVLCVRILLCNLL